MPHNYIEDWKVYLFAILLIGFLLTLGGENEEVVCFCLQDAFYEKVLT